MFVQRFFVEGLAHASYLFGQGAEAAVVDPRRDVDEYLESARRRGATIVAVFETHPHADFVSGHVELSARTGAPIYVSRKYPARFPHQALACGDNLVIGGVRVICLETPGHSPDSICLWAADRTGGSVFTGDTLFVGDVGRPDLREEASDPAEMAGALFHSLHEVLWKLPDHTVVYPAHGAGSLCGRRLGTAPSSTIGAEKANNWAGQIESRDEFTAAMLADLPERPLFFRHCPAVNMAGPRPLGEVPRPRPVGADELRCRAQAGDALILDTRDAERFGSAHLDGSLNVGLEQPVFSTWVGTFVPPEQPLHLVLERREDALRAWLELARIGYERAEACLVADPDAWRAAGLAIRRTCQLDAGDVDGWMASGRPLLDVRTPAEWSEGRVQGAIHIPLPRLPERLAEVPPGPVAVLCGSGYRSSLAGSLLQRAGREEVVNVRGGWSGYRRRACPEPDSQDLYCR